MVIYDTKNNFDGQARGMLYISAYDIAYLCAKYGEDLKCSIPLDYFEAFEHELAKRKQEDVLSVQWYAMLPIGIETDEDEELLKIIAQEVSEGNMMTRKQLQKLSYEELLEKTDKYPGVYGTINRLPIEDMYKLRSYEVARCIIDTITGGNQIVEELHDHPDWETDRKRKKKDTYAKYMESLKAMGADEDIVDSDYFQEAEQISRTKLEIK